MTANTTDDDDKPDTDQIGARVNSKLNQWFKTMVEQKRGSKRGKLGEEYEFALKLALAVYFLPNQEEAVACSETMDRDPEDAMADLSKYIDDVGPELLQVLNILDTGPEDLPKSGSSQTGLLGSQTQAAQQWQSIQSPFGAGERDKNDDSSGSLSEEELDKIATRVAEQLDS